MKIVIDINEEDLTTICKYGGLFLPNEVVNCFRISTPLEEVLEDIKTEIKTEIVDYEGCADFNEGIRFGLRTAIEIIDKHLSGKETWNGIHAQVTAPKGTFEKIYKECDTEDDGI